MGGSTVRLEPAQRTLVAALAARAGQRVAIDVLVDAMWPDGEPRTGRKTLQGHIARLRRAVGDATIVYRAGSYALDLEQAELDVGRVEALIAAARHAAAAARFDDASHLLEEASRLFRGRPFEDVPEHVVPAGEQRRLEELRSLAFEERIDAELGAGRHLNCIGDLESFVQANPLRERGWAQLITALYRSHRQADALRAYGRLRKTLAEELGIEPSTELMRLEHSILTHDPALEWRSNIDPINREPGPLERGRGTDVGPAGVDWYRSPAPTVLPLPDLLAVSSEIAFTGREVELTQLAGDWTTAEQGRCHVVVITGEPGIGKTRLVTEAAHQAYQDGGIILYGRCDEGLGAPYRPVIEALRHVVTHLRPADLSDIARHTSPELGRLLPELQELLDLRAPAVESDAARIRLFDAVASFIAALGTRAPLLLALDDLQWADDATLLLLRHVVTRSPRVPLLVVATYRDTDLTPEHPLLGLVADLHRDHAFHRIALSGLDEPAVATLAASLRPADKLIERRSIGTLLERTNGNPFFVLQLVHHLAEGGEADADWTSDRAVPEGVRDVIRRRLSRLSERARNVLRVAAVAGDDFDLALLESVVGTGDELDAVESAAVAALVVETPNPTRFHFAHSLVRETLFGDVSAARRARLHRAIGEALARTPGTAAADVARHLRAGVAAGGVDEAIEWSLTAIDEAFTRLAREDVAGQAAAALEVLDRIGERQSERRARLLCSLSLGRSMLGDMSGRKTHALAAAEMARALGAEALLIEAVLLYTGYFATAPPDPVARDLVEEALRVAGPTQPAQRSQLLCNYALYSLINAGGGRLGAQEVLEEAVPLARASGDRLALTWALTTQCLVMLGAAEVDAQLRAAQELEQIVDRSPPTQAARAVASSWEAGKAAFRRRLGPADSIVLRQRAVASLQLGDRAGFDHNHRQLRLLADATVDWLPGTLATLWDGLVALMEGRVTDVEQALQRLLEASHGDLNVIYSYGAQLFQLRREQGRLAEMLPMFERSAATPESLAAARAFLALLYSELGRNADARRIFDALSADNFSHIPQDWLWSCVLAVLGEVCWRLHDRDQAELLEGLCEPYGGQLVVVSWGVCCLGAMDRYRGMLADVLGETAAADRLFAAAAGLERGANALALLARTQLAWAASILRTDQPRARRLASEASATARELGLAGLRPINATS